MSSKLSSISVFLLKHTSIVLSKIMHTTPKSTVPDFVANSWHDTWRQFVTIIFLCLPSDMSHTASPVPETCKKSTGSMPTYTPQSEAVKLRAETIQFSDIGIMYSPLSVMRRIMFDQHAHHVFYVMFFQDELNWPATFDRMWNGHAVVTECNCQQLTDPPTHPNFSASHETNASAVHTTT